MADLASMIPTDDTIVVNLKHPLTEEPLTKDDGKEMTITVYAPHSSIYKAVVHEQTNKRIQKAAKGKKITFTAEELEMMVEAVIVGGTDTTRNQLGLALVLFAENPEQWNILRERPELAPRAVEEVMRYHGAVGGTVRFASEDIEYNGVLFPKGTFMSTSMGTGNFDESVFPAPDSFDITREPVGQPQLSFGAGIHYCLGVYLAKMESRIAIETLIERWPNFAIDHDNSKRVRMSNVAGFCNLPMSVA
mgnify:CR=1 FL=1